VPPIKPATAAANASDCMEFFIETRLSFSWATRDACWTLMNCCVDRRELERSAGFTGASSPFCIGSMRATGHKRLRGNVNEPLIIRRRVRISRMRKRICHSPNCFSSRYPRRSILCNLLSSGNSTPTLDSNVNRGPPRLCHEHSGRNLRIEHRLNFS